MTKSYEHKGRGGISSRRISRWEDRSGVMRAMNVAEEKARDTGKDKINYIILSMLS